MFGLTSKLTPRTRKSAARGTFKPQIDALEERMVLSANSPAIHAVTDAQGHSAVFEIEQQNYQVLYEHDAAHGFRQVGSAGNIDSFSAGLDANGKADVFVKTTDGTLTMYTDTTYGELVAHVLGNVKSFAAVNGGRVYATFADDTLHEWNGSAWTTVSGVSGTVRSLDAVTDKSGNDAVFMIKGDNTFAELYHGTYRQLANSVNHTITLREPDLRHPGQFITRTFTYNTPAVSDFSAGTTTGGNADVFAKFSTTFRRNISGTAAGWVTLSAASSIRSFSATTNGQVQFIGSDSHLKKFDLGGNLHVLDSTHSYLSLSAAASNDVFGVRTDHNVWERSAAGVFTKVDGSGEVQK